jgi:hypothetical protein
MQREQAGCILPLRTNNYTLNVQYNSLEEIVRICRKAVRVCALTLRTDPRQVKGHIKILQQLPHPNDFLSLFFSILPMLVVAFRKIL